MSLRITGLVRLADAARRELARPLLPERKAYWQRIVRNGIAQVEQILQRQGASPAMLPAPSRRALDYLRSIDWDRIPTAEDVPAERSPVRLSWQGLGGFLDRMLDRLAAMPEPPELEKIGQLIAQTSRQIESTIARTNAGPEHLTPAARGIRGWLAFFAEADNRAAYIDALKLALPIFDTAARELRYPMPLSIHFRPAKVLYRIPRPAGRTVLWLPTPMIAFEEAEFRAVADLIRGGSPQATHRVVEAMEREPYQTVHAELESLAGIPEQTRGTHHDLAASFDRVNAKYFESRMPRPHLTWSRMLTGRKLGHYDSIRDTVMISATLDTPKAEPWLVDFLMYHELLHKHLGSRVFNGRRCSHTPEFHALERRFERHPEVEPALRRLLHP